MALTTDAYREWLQGQATGAAQGTPAGQEEDADLEEPSQANGVAQPPTEEDLLLDRLMARLRLRGPPPGRPAQPQPEPGEGQQEEELPYSWDDQEDQQWGQQSWDGWYDGPPGMSSGWSSWPNWKSNNWKSNEDRPYISHLDFPKFDGRKEEYSNYQYAVMNLKSQCTPKDYKFLAPKLISNFTGSMSEDARAMELLGSDYQVHDGVERLLAFIRKRLHITNLGLETEAFEKYFTHLVRKRGETLMKYINAEETAYRKLQRVLKTATDAGEDEYSSDDVSLQVVPAKRKFQLPKRLRGWHFLERAGIPLKEHSGILNQTGGVNIDKLKKVMAESLPEKVLKDIDSRTTPKAPWQKRPFKNPSKGRSTPQLITSLR